MWNPVLDQSFWHIGFSQETLYSWDCFIYWGHTFLELLKCNWLHLQQVKVSKQDEFTLMYLIIFQYLNVYIKANSLILVVGILMITIMSSQLTQPLLCTPATADSTLFPRSVITTSSPSARRPKLNSHTHTLTQSHLIPRLDPCCRPAQLCSRCHH